MLDIVIPARDEAGSIGAVLGALLADAEDLALCVVVALNGEDQHRTAQVIDAFARPFGEAGHRLITVRCSEVGKPAALNAGDRSRSGGAVIYLDADAVILPGTLAALARELDTPEPRLAGPRREFMRPQSRVARSFARVLQSLRTMENFIGMGAYAVNPAGRSLWGEFPPLVADDAFVFTRFEAKQRTVVHQGGIWIALPEGLDLVRMVRRWHEGNKAPEIATTLRRKAPVDAIWLRRNWRLLPDIPIYCFVLLAAVLVASPVSGYSWKPVRRPSLAPPARRLRIRVVIVTFNSAPCLAACLDSLASRWSDLEIVIVDNASSDASVAIAATHPTSPKLYSNPVNRGFALAVNQGADGGDFDHLLLCNPDVVAERGAIDVLLSLALRFPQSGLQGGRMTDTHGHLDHTSALAEPGLRQALAFGLGASALPAAGFLDPDRLGGWDRRGTRSVPILTGAFLMISAAMWRKVSGLDPHFFLYGEDVDLSMRARCAGAKPLHTDRARYVHAGGASSRDDLEREICILRGKANLYRRYVPVVGLCMLTTGVALRAFSERFVRKHRHWRRCWARRQEWMIVAHK